MSETSKLYKILYVDKAEAMTRGGLVFNNQLEANEYIKTASEESPRFHYWVEPVPEPQETLKQSITAPNPIFQRLSETK